jgi:hypothetical protein
MKRVIEWGLGIAAIGAVSILFLALLGQAGSSAWMHSYYQAKNGGDRAAVQEVNGRLELAKQENAAGWFGDICTSDELAALPLLPVPAQEPPK